MWIKTNSTISSDLSACCTFIFNHSLHGYLNTVTFAHNLDLMVLWDSSVTLNHNEKIYSCAAVEQNEASEHKACRLCSLNRDMSVNMCNVSRKTYKIKNNIFEVVTSPACNNVYFKNRFLVYLSSNVFYASQEPYIGEEAVVKKKAKRISAHQMR